MIRLCRDCKWMRLGFWQQYHSAKCAYPTLINLVSGEADIYCYRQRESEQAGKCGPEGKFWEPKNANA